MNVDYLGATANPSPNFGYLSIDTHGRLGHLPVAIVDHSAQGSESALQAWFGSLASAVSAHYSVAKDGRIYQHVSEDDAAWANGINPAKGADYYRSDLSVPWIADLYRMHVNANLVTISIEHEGLSGQELTTAQYQSSLALHADIFRRHNWPLEWGRIVAHAQVNRRDKPDCPGPAFPFARLYAELLPLVHRCIR